VVVVAVVVVVVVVVVEVVVLLVVRLRMLLIQSLSLVFNWDFFGFFVSTSISLFDSGTSVVFTSTTVGTSVDLISTTVGTSVVLISTTVVASGSLVVSGFKVVISAMIVVGFCVVGLGLGLEAFTLRRGFLVVVTVNGLKVKDSRSNNFFLATKDFWKEDP